MNDTIEPLSTREIRSSAAMLARRLGKPTLVDPYEHAWTIGKLDDDEFRAAGEDPEGYSFAERRELAILIAARSMNAEGKPSDLDLGLILATVNGNQSLEDLRAQLS
jgi:hypothetical protein